MMHVGSMAFSDAIVLQTLRTLLDEAGPESLISQTAISERSGVPIKTTQRALKRLKLTGRIEGEFRVGIGYRYRLRSAERTG